LVVIVLAAVLSFSFGCSDEDAATAPGEKTVATPTFDPPGGAYFSVQHVKISCATADAFVYYTLDGADPDESSTLCAAGDSIEVERTFLLKARAYKAGMNPSAVAEAAYAVDLPDVAAPYFEPAPGVYAAPQDVIIHCPTAFARIFYTTDGSEPDTNATEFIFQTTIPVDAAATLRARAFKKGMDPSEEAEAAYAVIPGLVAFYPFEGNADDASGNAHHGTVYGASPVADRFGSAGAAFQFDGTDDYIELSDESAFDLSEFTVSFWTRITTLPTVPGPTTPGYYCVVSKATFNLGNYTVRLFKIGGASYCYLEYAHGTSLGNWNTSCYTSIHLNQYYHVVVTMSDEIRCYYDGVLRCTSSSMPAAIQTDANVLIGRFYDAADPCYFNGIIDDVRFYNRALSAAEIEGLHQAESRYDG
jgi:hypothetical protein